MIDEFDFGKKPRKWTIPDRKHALIKRDPLAKAYDKKLKQWLNDRINTKLKAELDELGKKIKGKWRVRIYIPETTFQGLTDFWFPISNVYNGVEDARLNTSLTLT